MKIDRSKVNLLAEGPNKLRVGDKVRTQSCGVYAITRIDSMVANPTLTRPIQGTSLSRIGKFEYWRADGITFSFITPLADITAIIRPARSEPLTEVIFGEIARARAYREYWSFDCVASGLLK